MQDTQGVGSQVEKELSREETNTRPLRLPSTPSRAVDLNLPNSDPLIQLLTLW